MIRDWKNLDSKWLFKQTLPPDAFFHRLFTYDDVISLRNLYKQIKQKNSIFIVAYEGYTNIIDALYKDFICPLDIDESKVTLSMAALNVQELINEFAVKYNRKSVKGLFFPFFEYFSADQFFVFNNREEKLKELYTLRLNSDLQKTYTNLNRRWALHRSVCVGLLYHFNLLDKGFVSYNVTHPIQALKQNKTKYNKNISKILNINDFANTDDPQNSKKLWEAVLPYIVFKHKSNEQIYNIFTNDKSISNIPELKLPSRNLFEKDLDYTYGYDDQLDHVHTYSLVNLVTESFYYADYQSPFDSHTFYDLSNDNSLVYTEKVWRPITFKQPFIVLSCPGYLKGLQDLGYKTFSPFIDESYDSIKDDSLRMLKVLGEIQRLSLLSPQEQKSFLLNVDEICQHNYNHFKSRFQTFLTTL